MSFVTVIVDVLIAGAALFGESAVKEAGKSAAGTAFGKLKALVAKKGAPAVALLEGPGDKSHYRAALEGDLARSEIDKDAEIIELTEAARAEILAHRDQLPANYAVVIERLEAAEGIIFERVEGIRLGTAKTEGVFRATDVTGPKRP